MACRTVQLPDGTTAIVCGPRAQTKPCVTCGSPGTVLCDYPVKRNGKDGTCDRPSCRKHATPVDKDKDYCAAHAQYAERLKL
jgi:hypothetical protein